MSIHEQIEPKCSFDDLVLPDEVMAAINEVLEDHEFQLKVRRRILLHGPSGCGKTSIAHALARKLKIKLHEISTAQVTESHLGATERNTENIFKFAQSNRVVVLIDEFDGIGAARIDTDSSSSRTENRQVNTVLTGLEGREPLGMIVACTNLFDQIDEAIMRRFDLILEIPMPGRVILKKIAQSIIKDRYGITVDEVLAEASTPAMVVRVAQNKLRKAVIARAKSSREVDMQQTFSQLQELKTNLNKKTRGRNEPSKEQRADHEVPRPAMA
jgi:SpoVK/Ycf46/Vps4 family AAA+-type ATPase